MGSDDDGGAPCGGLLEEAHHDAAGVVVHRCQRLVGQDDLWSRRERAPDRHPLALSRRHLMWVAVPFVSQTQRFQRFESTLLHRPEGHVRLRHLQRQGQVLQCGEPGEQVVLLEDERDVAANSNQASTPQTVQALPLDQ